ncbi:retrovirus-related pol polyprotein from transposon TNT 1-94 [Tanacetum coccineum]
MEDQDACLLIRTMDVKQLLGGFNRDMEAQTKAELNKKAHSAVILCEGDYGEGLYVKGKTDRKGIHRNCPKNNRKKSTGYVKKDEQPSSSGSTYDDSEDTHVNILYDFSGMLIGGSVRRVIQHRSVISESGKVKVINGSKGYLSGIQRDHCVYSLDPYNVKAQKLEHISEAGLQVVEKQGPVLAKKSLAMGPSQVESLEVRGSFLSIVMIIRRTVKKLRTDNGLEFYNREFEQLCIESGIVRHLTVPGTPQQNGVTERMNRTLRDKDVGLLFVFGNCQDLLGRKRHGTAAYLNTRSPFSQRLRKKTPIEMWSGHPSDYRMLRIFNCVAYSHVKQEEEDTHEPLTYQEAVACEDSSKWKAAMEEEMDSLRKNKTWELVDPSAGQKLVSSKWLYKIKEKIKGVQKPRYKARQWEIGQIHGWALSSCRLRMPEGARQYELRKVSKQYWRSPGFVDSDYAKDPDKGRSITGYAFFVHGCVVSWKATIQHVVALSTTEAEYMALTEAVKEAIWLRGLLKELGVELNTVAVNCDNQGAIHLSRNYVFHERTKHINVCYHFIREVLEAKTVKVLKVDTKHNAADALTKVYLGRKLQHSWSCSMDQV